MAKPGSSQGRAFPTAQTRARMKKVIYFSQRAVRHCSDPATALRNSVARVLAANVELCGAIEYVLKRLDAVDHDVNELSEADTKAELTQMAGAVRDQLSIASGRLFDNFEKLSEARELLTEAIIHRESTRAAASSE